MTEPKARPPAIRPPAIRPTAIRPTGREAPFAAHELIVSKTDLRGRITYCNDVFLRVSGYTEREMLGAPHSIIRHPDMPRCVFRLMWETIQGGGEIFAYVVNLAKTGDHYWVLAHVTPSLAPDGSLLGYHSNRRKPEPAAVRAAADLYRELKAAEDAPANRRDGLAAGAGRLDAVLQSRGVSYDRFVLAL